MDRSPYAEAMTEVDSFLTVDLPNFLYFVAKQVMWPAILLLAAFGGAVKILLFTQSKLYPPPKHVQYVDAIKMYREGDVKGALEELSKIEYGRSFLARACHEIYVIGSPESIVKGIAILKEGQERKLGIDNEEVKMMRSDAAAILSGNAVMVRTSANLAKEEYLGVISW
eukprot:scaffold909_cov135-Cylindrotheca_fusiformis.AAC.12